MIDDILVRLRQAHDEWRVPNQHAIVDRARVRIPRDSDYRIKWQSKASPLRAGDDLELPSADDIVYLGRDERNYTLTLNSEFKRCQPCPRTDRFPEMCGSCPLPPGRTVWLKVPKIETEEV